MAAVRSARPSTGVDRHRGRGRRSGSRPRTACGRHRATSSTAPSDRRGRRGRRAPPSRRRDPRTCRGRSRRARAPRRPTPRPGTPLNQRTCGRDLVQRVVLDAEELRERALDEVVDRRTAGVGLVVERGEHRGVDAGVQLGHPGNVAAAAPARCDLRQPNRFHQRDVATAPTTSIAPSATRYTVSSCTSFTLTTRSGQLPERPLELRRARGAGVRAAGDLGDRLQRRVVDLEEVGTPAAAPSRWHPARAEAAATAEGPESVGTELLRGADQRPGSWSRNRSCTRGHRGRPPGGPRRWGRPRRSRHRR